MNRGTVFRRRAAVAAALCLWAASPALGDSAVSQEVRLKPGWNAVYLEVQPEPDDPALVFAGIPIESVWTRFESSSSVQFIQNPGEGEWNRTAWGVYYGAEAKAFLNNLFAIRANRAYLIKLGGDQPLSWSVEGTPSVAPTDWVADSFNLVGFRVNAGAAPTFADFFRPSPAHAGRALFRLGDGGEWQFVDDPSAHRVRAGEAYWVYCEGASEFQGPLEIGLPSRNGIDFGPYAKQLTIAVHNLSREARTVTIAQRAAELDLTYRTLDPKTGTYDWPPLGDMAPVVVGPGRWLSVRLAVRRETLTAERASTLLRISDDRGTRLDVPVLVEREATR